MKKKFTFKIKTAISLCCLALFIVTSTTDAQTNLRKFTENNTKLKVNNKMCETSQKALKKYLQKLKVKKEKGQVSSGGFKTYLKSAERYLQKIKKKCPDMDISIEKNELSGYKKDFEDVGNSDGNRMATIRKGYYDKAIDKLVPETHPSFNDFKQSKSNFLVYAFEYYRHKKPAKAFKKIKETRDAFNKIKSSYDDLDFSLINSELTRLENLLQTEFGTQITETLQKESAVNYFKNIYINWLTTYSSTSDYAEKEYLPLASGKFPIIGLAKKYENFTKKEFLQKVEDAKKNGTFPRVQIYAETVVKGLEDYPNYINTKLNGVLHDYFSMLNAFGIKGNVQKEIAVLEAAKTFCNLLLKFAPNHPKPASWLQQVNKEISKRVGSISYVNSMHKKHLSKMLFSKKQIAVGNESEDDFTNKFTSNNYIYATVYLSSTVRKLTDSYAANDVKIRINGGILDEPKRTAVWITTPMQEKTYLQFAIIPDANWSQKYESYYYKNKLRTHEIIASGLINAGTLSGITVDVEIIFRGTNAKIKGSFTIDQTGGLSQLKKVVANAQKRRLENTFLPKSGMVNTTIANQALSILRKKSGTSKTYTKAIITSANWDYDKAYTGIVVSRSLVIAIVSKEDDGQCMYQLFNFKQQAKGNGAFNNNLELAGAGLNTYLSCKNTK